MQHLPVFLDVKGREALVVGGGEAAARKVRLLVQAGAMVVVVAPKYGESLRVMANKGEVRLLARSFTSDDVGRQAVVIAATGLWRVDADVSKAAKAAGIPAHRRR